MSVSISRNAQRSIWEKRDLLDIHRIVLHHTVTSTDVSPERIAEVHVSQGKPGIAYHFLVMGMAPSTPRNHSPTLSNKSHRATSTPNINADSVAVVLAGDFRASRNVEPTEEQRFAAAHLIAWLIESLGLGTDIAQIVFGRSELGEACDIAWRPMA